MIFNEFHFLRVKLNMEQLMNYLKIFTAILIINSTFINAQQNYHFKVFPESEKLSNLQINDLFQDSYGFMWIVTNDGLE